MLGPQMHLCLVEALRLDWKWDVKQREEGKDREEGGPLLGGRDPQGISMTNLVVR